MSKRQGEQKDTPSKKVAQEKQKVVLAYSGGLDTSVILVWLVQKGFDVICFCANVGQGDEDYDAVRAKALGCGASKVYVEDLRKEFVTDFIAYSVKSNGTLLALRSYLANDTFSSYL
jgi:argininosuccinate synthase